MVTRAETVSYETAPTVLEALVREAALIKKYMPPANVEGKDDSSFLYVIVTAEELPRVLSVRGKDIDFKNKLLTATASCSFSHIFGPFPSGAQLREALRLLQRIFPFYDTARPVQALKANKHHTARIEFNKQIHQYPKTINVRAYKKTIRNVCLFLSGQGKKLRQTLEREMKAAAKAEKFEQASEIRRELFALDHVQDVSLIKDEQLEALRSQTAYGRIEAYDTAHLAGTNAIGVMTVLEDGAIVKKEYRTFNIKGFKKNDDIGSLKELLTRRFSHPEWESPRAIVVDGGATHKKAAERMLVELGLAIPVVAVVKDERHRPREVIGAKRAHMSEADAVLANSEAHRFSLSRHRRARSKETRR
jgi:excinuclease ABC subunit C